MSQTISCNEVRKLLGSHRVCCDACHYEMEECGYAPIERQIGDKTALVCCSMAAEIDERAENDDQTD